jgi:hypothetical protein
MLLPMVDLKCQKLVTTLPIHKEYEKELSTSKSAHTLS